MQFFILVKLNPLYSLTQIVLIIILISLKFYSINLIHNSIISYYPGHVGDVIEGIEIVDEGWWKGTCNGKEGMFPSNFVERMTETTPEANTSANKPCPVLQAGKKGRKKDFLNLNDFWFG